MNVDAERTTKNDQRTHDRRPRSADLVAGLTMVVGRRAVADAVVDLASVDAGDTVVDVGCGPGVAARVAARRGARVVGVDPSPTMLRLASTLTRGSARGLVTFKDGTASHVGLPDDSATVVWALASAHHWPDIAEGLSEARRVLRPGGRLVIWERVATGRGVHGSHGFTGAQAQDVAARLAAHFVDVTVESYRIRRSQFVAVRAVLPR